MLQTYSSILFFAFVLGNAHGRPCLQLPMIKDKFFLHLNLVDLFKEPERFYASINKFMSNCYMHYIDLSTVEAPDDDQPLWIAYVGDSLVRELFHGAAQRFGGYMAVNEAELEENLLPKHLGPPTEDVINTMHNTYHQEKLLCCRSNYVQPGSGHPEGSDSCIFALGKGAAEGNEEALEKYKMYLFDDMAEYIEDFVVPLYAGNFKCLSFSWAPRMLDAVTELTPFLESSFAPSVLILNPGLHSSQEDEKVVEPQLDDLIDLTEKLADKRGVKLLYHLPTYVNELASGFAGKLENRHIVSIAGVIRDSAKHWPALDGKLLDPYNYTKGLHDMRGCGRADGVHFEAVCNYQALVTQWDFNWLQSIGAIKINKGPRNSP